MNDIVTIRITDDIDFYILIHEKEEDIICGEIVTIGQDLREEYEEWKRGDKVQVNESSVLAIIPDN